MIPQPDQNGGGGGAVKPFQLQVEVGFTPSAIALLERLLSALTAISPAEPLVETSMVDSPPAPAAAVPAAPPECAGMPVRGGWITPARDAVLDRDYPAGVAASAILEAVNALPGAPVGKSVMVSRAIARGLRRLPVPPLQPVDEATGNLPDRFPSPAMLAPPETAPSPSFKRFVAEVRAEAAAPPPPPRVSEEPDRSYAGQASAPQATPTAPVRADYDTIRSWAAQRGLAPARERMDLAAVNRKRLALGLAPFEMITRGRGAVMAAE